MFFRCAKVKKLFGMHDFLHKKNDDSAILADKEVVKRFFDVFLLLK